MLYAKTIYRIVKIYYESFNFAKFAILNALAKIEASIHFGSIAISSMNLQLWIHISSESKVI